MTPDPNITGAATVEQLMEVLNKPPYQLGVPTLAGLPKGSTLFTVWGLPVKVTADPQAGSYEAAVQLGWPLILDLTVEASTFSLTGLAAPAAEAGKEQT